MGDTVEVSVAVLEGTAVVSGIVPEGYAAVLSEVVPEATAVAVSAVVPETAAVVILIVPVGAIVAASEVAPE